jgi:hypothetical protein
MLIARPHGTLLVQALEDTRLCAGHTMAEYEKLQDAQKEDTVAGGQAAAASGALSTDILLCWCL